MNRFIQFCENLYYLSRFSVRNKLIKNPTIKFSYEDLIENILYYIPESNVIRPKILDKKSTIDLLVNSNLSLARFGDGELSLVRGFSIPYQDYDKELANKIINILENKQENLLVGINHWYFYCQYDPQKNDFSKRFEMEAVPIFRKELLKHINLNTTYCSADINGLGELTEVDYNKLKQIWNDKKVLIITCKEALKRIEYNIYDNAKQVDYILVPNKNSYSKYNQTLNSIKDYNKDTMIILMCGPLSKILASDLSNIGYRALDLGHLMKSYDYHRKNIKISPDITEEFYQPDV